MGGFLQKIEGLLVGVFTVADTNNQNSQYIIIDRINHTVITNTDAILVLGALQFQTAVRPRLITQRIDGFKDPVSGKPFSIEVRLGPFMYPSLVTTESPVVRAILRASEVMLGKPVETYYSPAAFDQGYLNHVGIATANFGAGEHQYAHTDFDMASVERTTDSARVYAFMTLDYLA